MSHFAKIDENGIVQYVLVIEQDEINTGNFGDPSQFIKTSYNTHGGFYYTPNTKAIDIDQSKAFRKNFAGIGFKYLANGPDGEGFVPPKPFNSWIMNNFSYTWEPPISCPQDGLNYFWNEETLSWNLFNLQLNI